MVQIGILSANQEKKSYVFALLSGMTSSVEVKESLVNLPGCSSILREPLAVSSSEKGLRELKFQALLTSLSSPPLSFLSELIAVINLHDLQSIQVLVIPWSGY